MPAVPYSGVPSVSPTLSGGQGFQDIRTSANTFGGQIGAAKAEFGSELEKAGDMMERHAQKMQAANNEAWANDAFVRGVEGAAQMKAQFNSMEGMAKAKYYEETYVPGIKKIANEMADSAPNIEARRMFQRDFRRRIGYDIENGASAAGIAMRQYNKQTADAVVSRSISDAVSATDKEFIFLKNKAMEAVAAKAKNSDWSDEMTAQQMQIATSHVWASRLSSLAKSNPDRARKLLEENKGEITGDVQLQLQDRINNSIVDNGTRVDADELLGRKPTIRANAARVGDTWGDPKSPDFESTRLTRIKTASGRDVTVNKAAAADMQGFLNELESNGYKISDIGGYNNRDKRGQPGNLSQHAYGNAIDINASKNPFGVGPQPTDLPPNIREIAAKYNMVWGGDWKGKVDNMHFEWAGPRTPVTADSDPARVGAALAEAPARARAKFPDSPELAAKYQDMLESRISTDYSKMRMAKNADELDRKLSVQTELFDTTKRVTDISQLSPRAQQAFHDSTPYNQNLYNAQFRKNATQDIPATNENKRKLEILYGMSASKATEEEFMKINPASLTDMTIGQQNQVMRWQSDKKARVERQIKMDSATSIPMVRAMLNDAGIFASRSDVNANQKWLTFLGGYEVALDDAQKASPGKKLDDKAKADIATALLRDKITGTTFFGLMNTTQPRYELEALRRPIAIETPADKAKLKKGQYFTRPNDQTVYINE